MELNTRYHQELILYTPKYRTRTSPENTHKLMGLYGGFNTRRYTLIIWFLLLLAFSYRVYRVSFLFFFNVITLKYATHSLIIHCVCMCVCVSVCVRVHVCVCECVYCTYLYYVPCNSVINFKAQNAGMTCDLRQ